MNKQEEEGSEMPYSYEEGEDLHECCSVDCDKPGTELLITKSWTGVQYGGKNETGGTRSPVTSGYYCRNHIAEKLESLAKRYRSGSSGGNTSAGTAAPPDVNLAATTPKR
jgi:hypothetical protein